MISPEILAKIHFGFSPEFGYSFRDTSRQSSWTSSLYSLRYFLGKYSGHFSKDSIRNVSLCGLSIHCISYDSTRKKTECTDQVTFVIFFVVYLQTTTRTVLFLVSGLIPFEVSSTFSLIGRSVKKTKYEARCG